MKKRWEDVAREADEAGAKWRSEREYNSRGSWLPLFVALLVSGCLSATVWFYIASHLVWK